MAETTDTAGFDRRSLIKKGLVVGGVAATAPVISTFNVPAFAASPGTYNIAINITTLLGGITVNARVDPEPDAGCTEIQPAFVGNLEDPGQAAISISPVVTGAGTQRTLTFALTGEAAAECTFIAARRRGGNGTDCTEDTPAVPSGSVAFPINQNHVAQYHFVVQCT